jgi:ribosomal protein L16 Arg81 hydroxylase
MDLAAFIAPFPADRFLGEIHGRAPLHVPAEGEAGERRRALLPWDRLNHILAVASHWTEANAKVILNGMPLGADHYVDEVATPSGPVRRADPAKIHAFLAMGASLVADSVEDASSELRRVTAMLSERFLGTSGANAYCSFRGIQAFHSHCDLHDVFAVHTEGEKVWRIYENRAPDPVEQYQGEDAQALIERTKGRVMMEVRMRPGDLLYIPRGFYHDALASSEASLHVTFSLAPHTARVLFRLLEQMAMQDPDFRAYLPDGREGEGRPLADRLGALADKAAALMRTPLFGNAVLNRQLALAKPYREVSLPERPVMDFYMRTQRQAQVAVHESGAFLVWQGGQAPLGLLEEPAQWMLGQNLSSMQQLEARFPQYGRAALDGLVALLRRAGLIEPCTPTLQ